MTSGDKPREFRQRAAECERLAELTRDSNLRETLLYVASRWRAMADEDETRRPILLVREPALTE